jgi:hypothetical protein
MRMTVPQETTDAEIARFRKLARAMGARAVIVSLHNYKGDIASERPVPQFPCYFVNDLDILYDGNTALCCMDHDGEYSWGDVKQHSVLEVFNSPVARRYRQMMRDDRRGELTPCNECNMFWWSLQRTGIRRLQYGGRIARYLVEHRPLRF